MVVVSLLETAIGLLSSKAGLTQLGIQAVGVGAGFVWAFGVSFPLFLLIKHTIGINAIDKVGFLDFNCSIKI